jgi:hypothetical protein
MMIHSKLSTPYLIKVVRTLSFRKDQLLNSFKPSRISFSVGVASPSLPRTRATAADDWALE